MAMEAARVRAPQVRERPEAPTRPRPQLTVAPPPPVNAPRTPFVVLVLLVVVGGVLGILMLNTKTNEDAFRLHELREQQAILDQRQEQLEQRIAEANSTAQARNRASVISGQTSEGLDWMMRKERSSFASSSLHAQSKASFDGAAMILSRCLSSSSRSVEGMASATMRNPWSRYAARCSSVARG